MSKRRSPSGVAVANKLHLHLAEMLTSLAKAGYAEYTRADKRREIAPFIRWVRKARLGIHDLDEASVAAFLSRSPRQRSRSRKRFDPAPAALQQFLDHLRRSGVIPVHCSESSPAEALTQRYLNHLSNNQGLSPRTVEIYAPLVRAFVVAQRLPERVAALDAVAVRNYLLNHSRGRSVPVVKLLAASLRSFLRFCFLDDVMAADLSTAVPPVRRWQLAQVPPFLTGEEVERVIATADRSTARGLRATAMLLLLARLGLRPGEVATLELDDIRWDIGEIVVRGKGRVHDRMPLLDDVGETLARYLREARGPSESRRVFLRVFAPRVGLSGPTAVCLVAREALRRAGLKPAGRFGAHIFRHSLATRMIRHGASIAEISQVLRHRAINTTQLYAKVEFEALRVVARPWPSMEAQR